MNYDAMGNYYGAVNDMLEPPATEANVKPVTQTITTDPKTGEQMMTVKGRPEDLSASNPNTPTVSQPRFSFGMKPPAAPAPTAAPVAPDQTYDRMLQAESGNRQFAPNGQVMTSPKGAMGAGQVMPATAMQPGYGVPSIFDMAQQRGMPVANRDQATAQQLLGNEQLNRDFGQTYFNAMQNKFGNQPAAVAAYNAGPGRVGQNMQANAGQMNAQQLPQETQGYLQKVLGAMNPIGTAQAAPAGQQPSLQNTPLSAPPAPGQSLLPGATMPQTNPFAGTPSAAMPGQQPAPATPVNPAQVQTQQVQAQPAPAITATGLTGTAATLPGLQAQPYVDQFLTNQNNPEFLSKLRFDKNAPDWMRSIASSQEYDYLSNERKKQQAQKELDTAIETGDTRKIAREAAKSDDEGSWFKMLLLGYISPQLAGREADKLGLTATWQPSMLGDQQVAAKFRMDGTALEGRYVSGEKAGQDLTAKELKLLYGQAAGSNKLDLVGGTYVSDTLKDKNGNALVGTVVRNKDTGYSYVQTDEGRKPMAGFRPQASSGSLADMRSKTIQDLNLKLQGKTAEEKLAILRPYNQQLVGQGYQPISADEVGLNAPQIGGAPSVAQPGTATTGTATTGATATGARPTSTEISAGKTRAEEAGKGAGKAEGEVVAKDIKNQNFADSSYSLMKPISDAIKQSTGSAIGSGVDTLTSAISKSTDGAKAIAKLDVLGYSLVSNVPRFEGPQGVRDVELYERAAGDLANSKKPVETRLAALDAVITLMKKYDKAGNNDWTFSSETKPSGGGIVILKREKI